MDIIAPPYTPEFVQLFLPLIENKAITGSIRMEDSSDPVSEFIGNYTGSEFIGKYTMSVIISKLFRVIIYR